MPGNQDLLAFQKVPWSTHFCTLAVAIKINYALWRNEGIIPVEYLSTFRSSRHLLMSFWGILCYHHHVYFFRCMICLQTETMIQLLFPAMGVDVAYGRILCINNDQKHPLVCKNKVMGKKIILYKLPNYISNKHRAPQSIIV